MVFRIFTPSFLLFPLALWFESHYCTFAFGSLERHNLRHSTPKRVLHVINLLPPSNDEIQGMVLMTSPKKIISMTATVKSLDHFHIPTTLKIKEGVVIVQLSL
jgi:hypothetical protein